MRRVSSHKISRLLTTVVLISLLMLTACQTKKTPPDIKSPELVTETPLPVTTIQQPALTLKKPADLYGPWTAPQRVLPATSSLVLLKPGEYPLFTDDMDFVGLDYAISQSLAYFGRIPGERVFKAAGTTFTKTEIERGLWKFKDFLAQNPSADQLNDFICNNFNVYQSKGRTNEREVMYTGYFEPIYNGSLTYSERFCHPVYSRPADLVIEQSGKATGRYNTNRVLVPYYTRAEIETQGVIDDKSQVLVWLESPLDAYFLHVQGSGRVVLPDGQSFHLNFDAKNGREYKSLGAALIDGGHMTKEEMSMQGIYDFFACNPELCQPLLHKNSSFVFFRAETEGPFGSLAVPITPGRTLALDREIYPPGALLVALTQKPEIATDDTIIRWRPIMRLMLNQDTGGAIKGSGRADFFWGSGGFAAIAAGYMKHTGKLYLLLPKN